MTCVKLAIAYCALLNEFRRAIEQLQWNIFIHQYRQPRMGVVGRRLRVVGCWRRCRISIARAVSICGSDAPQGWAATSIRCRTPIAQKLAIRAGLTSRSASILKQGEDPEQVDEENAADNARADALGLQYDTDPRDRDIAGDVPT